MVGSKEQALNYKFDPFVGCLNFKNNRMLGKFHEVQKMI